LFGKDLWIFNASALLLAEPYLPLNLVLNG
jgi:hypothetical protein